MGKKLIGRTYVDDVLMIHNTRFWAERGLIHADGPNGYEVLSVYQFLRHAEGICNMLGNTSAKRDNVKDAALRAEYTEIVERAQKIARKAQEQGMPIDPAACREYVRRRPTTVCVSGDSSFM